MPKSIRRSTTSIDGGRGSAAFLLSRPPRQRLIEGMVWMIALLFALLLGLTALLLGRRGRRIDTHPICRRCGYDLHGLDKPRVCPECGGELTHRRAMRVGNRRRRPVVAWAGVLLMLVSGVGLGVVGYERAAGIDWMSNKPVWVLRWEIDYRGPSASAAALEEMFGRYKAGQLNAEQVREMVADALAAQSGYRDAMGLSMGKID